jgi:hypothetical protein
MRQAYQSSAIEENAHEQKCFVACAAGRPEQIGRLVHDEHLRRHQGSAHGADRDAGAAGDHRAPQLGGAQAGDGAARQHHADRATRLGGDLPDSAGRRSQRGRGIADEQGHAALREPLLDLPHGGDADQRVAVPDVVVHQAQQQAGHEGVDPDGKPREVDRQGIEVDARQAAARGQPAQQPRGFDCWPVLEVQRPASRRGRQAWQSRPARRAAGAAPDAR